jgi:DNA-binding response OmpR family regulator
VSDHLPFSNLFQKNGWFTNRMGEYGHKHNWCSIDEKGNALPPGVSRRQTGGGLEQERGMGMRILAVEDERHLLQAISAVFTEEGYQVDCADRGDEGLLLAERGIYDLLVLDIMMPGLDGLSIVRKLRSKGNLTPVLFLTAKDSVEARVEGLDAGADDYLVKPFAVEELLARTRALLRRNGKFAKEGELSYGPICLKEYEHDGYVGPHPLRLTSKEYDLLKYFLYNREQILSRDQIFDRVWGIESEVNYGIVDLYVHYLRKKLADHGCDHYIRTIRNVGYILKGNKEHV